MRAMFTVLMTLFICTAPLEAKGFFGWSIFKPKVAKISPSVKVLIAGSVDSAKLEIRGKYRIFNPENGKRIETGFLDKSFDVTAHEDGLKWGAKFPDIYQITLVPTNSSTHMFVNDVRYNGKIYLYQVGTKINVVNEVQVEDYLKSTLASKLSPSLSSEVMEAIVIASRTEICDRVLRSDKKFWDVKASEVGYCGVGSRASCDSIYNAVNATKNVVMSASESKELFPALWTENSAGKTASYKAIFRRGENCSPCKSVVAPFAGEDRQMSKWIWNSSKKYLSSIVGLTNIKEVSVYLDKPSGKVYAIRFSGDLNGQKSTEDMDFISLQAIVGKNKLKSNDFSISVKKSDMVVFEGYGEGHSVGICLHSASKMASKGCNSSKILSTFFPGSKLIMNTEVWPGASK